jgi:hypothetical protein
VVSLSGEQNRILHIRLKRAQARFSEHRLSVFGERHAPPKSAAGAASQELRPRIALGAGGAKGSAKTPFVMNREIRRPAGTLQATEAAGVGKSAPYLVECGLRILLAEGGIRRMSGAQS